MLPQGARNGRDLVPGPWGLCSEPIEFGLVVEVHHDVGPERQEHQLAVDPRHCIQCRQDLRGNQLRIAGEILDEFRGRERTDPVVVNHQQIERATRSIRKKIDQLLGLELDE